jgi:hypothetical protein
MKLNVSRLAALGFLASLSAGPPPANAGRCAARLADGGPPHCRVSAAPRPTRTVALAANLYPESVLFPDGFRDDGTFDSAFSTSNFVTGIDTVDALGFPRMVFIFFTRTDTDVWSVNVGIGARYFGDLSEPLLTGGTSGTFVFGPHGRLRRGRTLRFRLPTADGGWTRLTLDAREVTQLPEPAGLSCFLLDGCP